MPNSNDEIGNLEIAANIDEIETFKIATNILFQTLVINAVRSLLAVLIAHWVLRSNGTRP